MNSLGRLQWGECQRCGERGYAKDLVLDGYSPNLLVCRDCYDPEHPQDRPFVPKSDEGKPKHPVAPELLPSSPPFLQGTGASAPAWDLDSWEDNPLAWLAGSWAEGGVDLVWTRPEWYGPRLDRYEVWRAFEDESFVKLTEIFFEYSDYGEVLNVVEAYTDAAAQIGVNRYYVLALSSDGQSIRSNTIEIEVV